MINVPFEYLFYAYHRKPVYDHVESDYEISHKTENKVQSPPKERPSNEHERQCVRIAKLFWEINDTLHPGLLVDTVEMIPYTKKKNGVMYLKDTIIKWIRPHWRKPYIGRPIHPKVWPISLPKDLL